MFNDEDQVVVLDGREWRIPGEIPVDYVLSLLEVQQELEKDPTNTEVHEKQYCILLEIFQKRHPELMLKQFKRMITARQTGKLVTLIMRSINNDFEFEKKTANESSEEQPGQDQTQV